jgi:hypothetical protein
MAAGAELLVVELACPYVSACGGRGRGGRNRTVALHRWARWLAILLAIIGIVLLLPSVSSAVIDFRFGKLFWNGLGVMVRTMMVWYLFHTGGGSV